MNPASILNWIKSGFFFGIGFCLAASFYYIIVSLIAGLLVPLLELALDLQFPDWFAWSTGIVLFVGIGVWLLKRKSKISQGAFCIVIVGVLVGFGFYCSGLQKTSVAAPLDQLEEIKGYTLELNRDYRRAGLTPCTDLPLVFPRANDEGFTKSDFLFNLIFRNLLAGTIKKDSGRCRIKVIPDSEISVKDCFLLLATESKQIIIPLEVINGEIFSESFVGVMDGGGIPFPGMHELLFEKPYNESILYTLVRYKNS
jgi:hypothetical protein